MLEKVVRVVEELVESGIDAVKAGINGLIGEKDGVPSGGQEDDAVKAASNGLPGEEDGVPSEGQEDDAVKAASNGLPEEKDGAPSESQEDSFPDSQGTRAPAEQEQEVTPGMHGAGDSALKPESSASAGSASDDCPPFWRNGVFQRGDQIGLYDFTTDPKVCGFYLNPEERWVQLRNRLFVSCPEMEALEAKYYRRVNELALLTSQQKYVKKVAYLVESEETQKYSDQLSFEALNQAHQKYSAASEEKAVSSHTASGRKPLPFQLALGTLVVQSIQNASDRETGRQQSENPFIQYFCGYSSFSTENHVSHAKISELKKVFDAEFMKEINEVFLKLNVNEVRLGELQKAKEDLKKAGKAVERAEKAARNAQNAEEEVKSKISDTVTEEEVKKAAEKARAAEEKVKKAENKAQEAQARVKKLENRNHEASSDSQVKPEEVTNAGSISIDATCNPGNAKYPMDFDLLNDARKKTEKILSSICAKTQSTKPKTHKKALQKEVKNLSKKKKKTEADIRPVISHSLQAIERNFGFIDDVCREKKYELTVDETYDLMVVKTVYGQQKYMYENNVRRVPHRIVSFSMPQLRPIVRGKVVDDVEFGPKTEISVDADGFVRLEDFSFEAYNEGTRLQDAIKRYKDRTGYYPEVVRCDQIYRTRENHAFCKEHGIRISGPRLGRKPKDEKKLKEQVKIEKADMVDRIEVERQFSREKHCWGLGRIMERTPERMEHAVGMGVLLNNLVPVGF